MFPSKAARSSKPKLSLCTSSSLVAPVSHHNPITPIGGAYVTSSPLDLTPTTRNTRANQRGISTYQQATYAYAQNPNTKSILRRDTSSSTSSSRSSSCSSIRSSSSGSSSRRVGFRDEPMVYCITPISYDEDDRYVRVTKETRWSRYE